MTPSIKTIIEPAGEVKVCYEADVVVVGAGPGGHSAAVAAARTGAKTVLVERYGHLGGMATGGLVILIPHLSDGTEKQQITGLTQEWLDRLAAKDAVVCPAKKDLGSSDEKIVSYWKSYSNFFVVEGRVMLSATVDPEILKCVLNDMAEEAGVKLYLHSWGTRAIVADNQVQGILFESKSGRQAILAKVVIDATGDGDLFPSAGAEFDDRIGPKLRIRDLALCFQLGNVDLRTAAKFKDSDPQKFTGLMQELKEKGGFAPLAGRLYHEALLRDNMLHIPNWIPCTSQTDVEELTRVEVSARKRIMTTLEFLKTRVPGFEKSFLMITAPQLGTRGSRRLLGEHMLTQAECQSGKIFEDTIAICPNPRFKVSPEHPHVHIPYRSMVPQKVNGLLAAGRSFSSEDVVNEAYNLIPHCIAMGQAAGTAAAMAVQQGIQVREINYKALQEKLIRQGVTLPEM
jgi:hypothetical protein